jgi:hypothetical protein
LFNFLIFDQFLVRTALHMGHSGGLALADDVMVLIERSGAGREMSRAVRQAESVMLAG